MLKNNVLIARNSMEPSTWELYEDVGNLAEFLIKQFDGVFPSSARIYHDNVSSATDVTPMDEKGVENLLQLSGDFHVVIYPEGDPISWAFIALVAAVVIGAVFLYRRIPNSAARNQQLQSPNNLLSGRTNSSRLGARIPAIYGTVQATPDLLSVYSVYINNIQYEYSYLCLGEGYYTFDTTQIFDGTTLFTSIQGNSMSIYNPYTSPNSGTPALVLGTPITAPLYTTIKNNAVNGQTLLAPNAGSYVADASLDFTAPNIITYSGSSNPDSTTQAPDFTTLFSAGGQIAITNSGAASIDNTYTIYTVSPDVITLSNPQLINTNWNTVNIIKGSQTLATTGNQWIGDFIVTSANLSQIWANFACQNGLYNDDGQNQFAGSVSVVLSITPCDATGTPTYTEEQFTLTLNGSSINHDQIASTMQVTPAQSSQYYLVKAARTTVTNTSFQGTVVDEVKWLDLYAAQTVPSTDFGNVTTIYACTQATFAATSVKERKINMVVTRNLPAYLGSNTFSTTLYPTNNAADIISAICLDPYIGNQQVSQVNFDEIYSIASTTGVVATYFGTSLACEFCYTFDNSNTTFEETIAMIADTVFCTAYRRGSQINLSFEKQTDSSVLLFNHRNKLPNSETRSVRFGNEKNYDGLWYQWVSPSTLNNVQGVGGDSIVTYYLPSSTTTQVDISITPNKVQSVGIRNQLQAYFHANRLWNKIQYQNVSVEFIATQEADILINNDRILVADSTRPNVQDGEVRGQTGLILILSQLVDWSDPAGNTIFLQHYDGTVESIGITNIGVDYEVLLNSTPRLPLVTQDDAYALTTYMIVGNSDTLSKAFLVTERSSNGDLTTKVSAINYDVRCYANDSDYINGIVSIDGNLPRLLTSESLAPYATEDSNIYRLEQ